MGDISEILDLAGEQLEDLTHITWDDDVLLLSYANLGILEIINLKPDAYPTTENLSLVAGTFQSLPTEAIYLIDIICNMGADGTIVGKAIRKIQRKNLDRLLPDWHTYTPTTEVSFGMIDPLTPQEYYVFPPQSEDGRYIRAVVCIPPALLTEITDPFPLDASYKPALVDYIVYRALAEETTIPNALNKATLFWNKFLQDLGLKTNVEGQIEQTQKAPPPKGEGG
jgi:hypothetical protein